jgi:hypothetical protein
LEHKVQPREQDINVCSVLKLVWPQKERGKRLGRKRFSTLMCPEWDPGMDCHADP